MGEISRIDIDISRTVFQLHAVRSDGSVVWRKRVCRSDFISTMLVSTKLRSLRRSSSRVLRRILNSDAYTPTK